MNLLGFLKVPPLLSPLLRGGLRRGTFSAWQIELTTRCPLRCKMCIREGIKDWNSADMSIDNFKRLIPYFKDVETVILEGWGESLLHRYLIDAIRLVREAGSQVGFVTSGKDLNKHYISELISSGVDFIGFSLSGSSLRTHESIRVNSDFENLLQNIKTFSDTKEREKLRKPKLHIVYLMVKDNIFEVPAMMRLAKDIGIDEIVLTNLIHITNEWQERQRVFRCMSAENRVRRPDSTQGRDRSPDLSFSEQSEEFLKEAEIKAKEFKVKLRRHSLSSDEVAVCEENPLRNLYISVDGEVSPCVYLYPPVSSPFKRIFCGNEFQLEKVSFGNIFRDSFDTIWNSKGYIEFREHFIKRKRKIGEMYSFLWDMERIRKFEIEPLPEPPEQCRTCHKMIGV